MIKHSLKIAASIAALWAMPTLAGVSAQDTASEVTYKFEPGQVIDFLFLRQRPDTEEALKAYARDAIAEARALDYKGLGGFSITRKPPQGNSYPSLLVFGAWPGDFSDRIEGLRQLKMVVPDLDDRRLDIWSRFDMINYEITEDKSFTVDRGKIQVLTAYWQKNADQFKSFIKEFKTLMRDGGGAVKLELTDPRSPFGYDYTPEYVVLTEWDTQANFDAFLKMNLAMDHSGVKHVNQFYLTPPKPRKG